MGLRPEGGERTIPSHFTACISCHNIIDLDKEAYSRKPTGVKIPPIKFDCDLDRNTGTAEIRVELDNSSVTSISSFEIKRTVKCPALAPKLKKDTI
jgi:hypothetical protein